MKRRVLKLYKIITVLGARPQFIKASAVSPLLSQCAVEKIIHTGQHYDKSMSDVFFNTLDIPKPEWNLGVQSVHHGEMTGKMLIEIESILLKERPDAVIVYGDTNSTLAGSLAAKKLDIPVAHVEAGARSFDMRAPEEVNRLLTDRVSTWHFAPTVYAKKNLLREGFSEESIFEVGDVTYDIFLKEKSQSKPMSLEVRSPLLLVTLHRQDNFEKKERVEFLLRLLEELGKSFTLVWPMHPRAEKVIQAFGLSELLSNDIIKIPPVTYHQVLGLLSRSAGVVTDSGGLQKDAYFSNKPCVTLRKETEWAELVDIGWNHVADSGEMGVALSGIRQFLSQDFLNKKRVNFYGDGQAGEAIVNHLSNFLMSTQLKLSPPSNACLSRAT